MVERLSLAGSFAFPTIGIELKPIPAMSKQKKFRKLNKSIKEKVLKTILEDKNYPTMKDKARLYREFAKYFRID
jgi:hypothetical protein